MFLWTVRSLKTNHTSSLLALDVTATWSSGGLELWSCRTWMLARKPKINTSHKLFMRRRLKKWLKKKSVPVCVRLNFKSVSLLKLEKAGARDTGAPPSVTCEKDFYFQRLKSDIIRREGEREKERKTIIVEGGWSFDTGALVTPLNHTSGSLFVHPSGCSFVHSLILMKARSTSLDTATDLFN